MDIDSPTPNTRDETRSRNNNSHKGRGHRQRLRDRFLAAGLDGFQDYEVIELLLTLGTPRKDCKDAAKEALAKFKTLQAVIEASPTELCEVRGIGPKNLFGIKLIQAVADRHFQKKLIRKDPINNSKELFDYLYHSLRDKH
jgi:DNA repair protein RadC